MCVCELVLGNFCACEMKEMQYVVTNNFIQPRCSEGAKYASNFEISPFSFMPNIAKFIFHLSSVQMWQIRLYRIWILLQHSILLTLRAQFYAQFVFCRTFHATCVAIYLLHLKHFYGFIYISMAEKRSGMNAFPGSYSYFPRTICSGGKGLPSQINQIKTNCVPMLFSIHCERFRFFACSLLYLLLKNFRSNLIRKCRYCFGHN